MRSCGRCGRKKPVTNFHKGNCEDGLRSYCKTCSRKYAKVWNNANREERNRKHREYWQRVKKQKRLSHLMKTYGISPADYKEIARQQAWKCAICLKRIRPLCVDHDHRTGKVRGLLCRECNSGLGRFKDSIFLLTRAVGYIEDANAD